MTARNAGPSETLRPFPAFALPTGMGFAGHARAFGAALTRDHGSPTRAPLTQAAQASPFFGHAVWGAASSFPSKGEYLASLSLGRRCARFQPPGPSIFSGRT